MGNHEFCEECGASDFHSGRPCDPETKAKYQKEQEEERKRESRAKRATIVAAKRLKALGYKVEIDRYGDITIDKYSLID